MKKYNETICYEIEKLFEDLEASVKTGEIDIADVSLRLQRVRKYATEMENGLKRRKEIMTEHNLEEAYQQSKGKKVSPNVHVNNLASKEGRRDNTPRFHITVKENDEVLYDADAPAFVMSVCESINDIDEEGILTGITQHMAVGHELAYWYAFDQLSQYIDGKKFAIMMAIKTAMETKMFSTPEQKQRILSIINRAPTETHGNKIR